jgi:uncharacterized protein DUF6152
VTSRVAAFVVGLSALVATAPVEGHHYIGCVYDTTALHALTGRIVEVIWKFPHVHVRLDAQNESTGGVEWDIETVNPGGLQRRGVEIDTLKVGDRLTTSVWVAKNGRREAFTHAMTLPGGNTVVFPIDQLMCPY